MNMLYQEAHKSPTAGAKAAIAVVVNSLWSGYVVTLGMDFVSDLIGAALNDAVDGDDDELLRQQRQLASFQKSHWRAARDLAGHLYFGDRLIQLVEGFASPWRSEDAFNAPILEQFMEIGRGFTQAGGAILRGMSDEDKEIAWKSVIKGLSKMGGAASTVAGNPFLIPYYRIKQIVKPVFFGEEGGGELDLGGGV